MRRERHVDRRAVAGLGAHLGGSTCARIVGKLVRAEEEHTWVVIEDVLGAVAVVHVEIHDEHPLHTMLLLRPTRGDRHIGKDAEAHPVVDQRMMAGRADERQAVFRLPPQHGVHQVKQPAGGPQRRFVAVGVDVGVGIQVTAAPCGDRLQAVEVGRRVDAQDSLEGRRRAGHLHQPVEHAVFGQQVHGGLEPAVVLRMSFQRVAQIERIVHDSSPSHDLGSL